MEMLVAMEYKIVTVDWLFVILAKTSDYQRASKEQWLQRLRHLVKLEQR